LHPDLLIHLFETLIAGDGWKLGKDGKASCYSTTSKQLAQDVFELATRLGRTPVMYGGKDGRKREGNRMNDWKIYVPSEKESSIMSPIQPVKTHYKGKVYCFEVPPHHIIMIRYNGKSLMISQSYEGLAMAHKAFWEESMVPHLSYIEEYLNDTLFLQIEHGRYMVKFDYANVGALHDDYKSKIDTAKTMVNIGFPLNAVNNRLQLGMPEVAWGDVWWQPGSMMPIDSDEKEESDDTPPPANDPKKPAKPAKPADDEDDATEDDTTDDAKKGANKVLWQKYIFVQLRVEELMKSKIKKFLFEQRKMVLENVAKDNMPVFDYKKEVVKLQRLLTSLYLEAMKIGATMIIDDNGGSPIQFRPEYPEVVEYLKSRTSLIPAKIMGTISKGLEKIFSKKEMKELYAESVRMLYNSITKRIGTIARTESSSVLVAGRVIQMQRLGYRYHRWITAQHDASRDSHNGLNNKVVKIGMSFHDGITLRYPGDLLAPADETINCRCFTVAEKSVKV
jgi:hypothetical protein